MSALAEKKPQNKHEKKLLHNGIQEPPLPPQDDKEMSPLMRYKPKRGLSVRGNKAQKAFKQISIPSLVDKLDDVFSLFIRLRDADKNGVVKCVTCGRFTDWKHNTDCGHFVGRGKYPTRWDEKNCAGQCKSCNGFEEGKKYQFGLAINEKYGAGTAERLEIKSKNHFKLESFNLKFLIAFYQNKVLQLKDEKGL